MGKILIFIGIALIFIGLLVTYKISIPFLGKLPGDIYIKGKNTVFYFPITTSLIISLILSLLLYLFNRS